VGEVQFALLHVGPTQAVEERWIPRLDLQRALDQRDRFVESRAVLRKHVAKVIERAGIDRIPRDHIAEYLLGIRLMARVIERGAVLEQNAGIAWRERHRLL